MKQFLGLLFISLATLATTGCTQRSLNSVDTLNAAIFGSGDIAQTKDEVDALPYASMYVKVNDQARAFMVLAFVDQNPISGAQQLKWLSADSAMIVTENGRVVKTVNLPYVNLESWVTEPSPIEFSASSAAWSGSYSWMPNYQLFQPASGTLKQKGIQDVSSLLWQEPLTHWVETVTFSALNETVNNHYYVNGQGLVLKTVQWLKPDSLKIELEILKPYNP
ncbi:YjbF family lipoprotein [Vibrio ulleungensis]|uniref:YjbF family lipoprotein n=1 Tax=Vibrio ulleungensis TaxID=2807619 RepID=A0ABS2HLW4_9VIBR|nr:YjbF family lipoprotein [Vibrio ulleungensis]MBM7037686.1 YjbF family lipoprotein [Vibrio ulleungensis]